MGIRFPFSTHCLTTFWPKSDKSKSFASDLKTDDIENVAKELISDTSGFTVFGVGEMKMTLEDMATNLMLSKARRVPRQAKEESLFTTVDSKKFKELQNRYNECESLVEVIEIMCMLARHQGRGVRGYLNMSAMLTIGK